MVKRKGGFRRKTRNKFQKQIQDKGKISIRRYLQEFTEGDRVTLSAEPAQQGGLYHPRFHGKSGVVNGRQGNCFIVKVKDGNALKQLLIHPSHLRRS